MLNYNITLSSMQCSVASLSELSRFDFVILVRKHITSRNVYM